MFEKHHQLADAHKVSEEIRDSFALTPFTKEVALTTLYVALFVAGGVCAGLWGIPTIAAFAATAGIAIALNQIFYKAPRYYLAQRTIQSLES